MSYSRVKIAARLRPAIPGEPHDNAIRVIHSDAGSAISVDNPRDPSQTFKYPFSSCYDHSSTQDQIFDRDVKPLFDLVFSGVTATVFAYGVTSSGKTHTMQGDAQSPGVIPRALEDIFRRATASGFQTSIAISYMEIYKDEVYDLLVDRDTAVKLPVRENEAGQVFVANLSTVPLDTFQDFNKVFGRANKQRSVSSTNLNSVSSRSHAILTIHVTVVDSVQNLTLSGKLNLVDLAGSENNKLTGNDATRMAESSAINKSLSVLGQVVHALNQGASRIPYRNSKLTRILQDALGGSSIGLLICNLAPGTKFRQDTLNTLNFAVRTKNIQNKPVVNQQANTAVSSKPLQLPTAHPLHNQAAPPPQPAAGPSRLPGPRPSRVPRPSAVFSDLSGQRSSLLLASLPEPVKVEEKPPAVPLHLTEEEINARIAKAVEVEVARRLQEERERQRREDEERAAAAAALASASASTSSSSSSAGSSASASHHPTNTEEDDSQLESLPSGLLTPLLKSKGHTSEDELKRRLDELEARFERANKVTNATIHLADVLSPISRKKTGRAYVALARSQSQKNNLEVALDMYRKAETYVPDNAKLRERIIEIEWAVKNNRTFNPSPKKRRRATQSKSKSGRSRRKATPDPDPEGDGSGKENVDVGGDVTEALSTGKRRVENAEAGTPPRKRRLVKFEEEE
ncbi:kinesin-domain-containing protein [Ganoderma leucocontextum]|nr:kinesin-domain-containing protein [Ganoderma leucocontextum]